MIELLISLVALYVIGSLAICGIIAGLTLILGILNVIIELSLVLGNVLAQSIKTFLRKDRESKLSICFFIVFIIFIIS